MPAPFPADAPARVLDEALEPDLIADGLVWAEGPCWAERLGGLLVSDVKGNTIYLCRPGEEKVVFLRPAGSPGPNPPGIEHGSNGLTLDARGALVLCDHGTRALYRLDEERWLKKPLATHFKADRLNSPNDVVLHRSSGALYFTDPPFGLDEAEDDPRRELPFCAVFRICDRTGHLDVATDALSHPNGVAFSPDGRTAYVSNSHPDDAAWYRAEVRDDGTFSAPEPFFREDGVDPDGGLPDGMVVDEHGYVYAAGPRGLYVFSPDLELVGTRGFGRTVSNVTIGEGGRSLFLTATDRVLRLRLEG